MLLEGFSLLLLVAARCSLQDILVAPRESRILVAARSSLQRTRQALTNRQQTYRRLLACRPTASSVLASPSSSSEQSHHSGSSSPCAVSKCSPIAFAVLPVAQGVLLQGVLLSLALGLEIKTCIKMRVLFGQRIRP